MDGKDQAMKDVSKSGMLGAETKQLGKLSTTIKQGFSDITSSLQNFDDQSHNEDLKLELQKLQTKWNSFSAVTHPLVVFLIVLEVLVILTDVLQH